eukprot:1157349-Pelagomonas_calceolata.AAC.14
MTGEFAEASWSQRKIPPASDVQRRAGVKQVKQAVDLLQAMQLRTGVGSACTRNAALRWCELYQQKEWLIKNSTGMGAGVEGSCTLEWIPPAKAV